MLEPDFDPFPTAVQIGRCDYACRCRAARRTEPRDDSSAQDWSAGRPV